MVRYMEILDNFLEQSKFYARCPEINSLLDMLFCCHLQQKSVDTAAISAYFRELDDILKELPIQKASQVVALACKLCGEHQKEAFQEGVRVGFRMYRELHMRDALYSNSDVKG